MQRGKMEPGLYRHKPTGVVVIVSDADDRRGVVVGFTHPFGNGRRAQVGSSWCAARPENYEPFFGRVSVVNRKAERVVTEPRLASSVWTLDGKPAIRPASGGVVNVDIEIRDSQGLPATAILASWRSGRPYPNPFKSGGPTQMRNALKRGDRVVVGIEGHGTVVSEPKYHVPMFGKGGYRVKVYLDHGQVTTRYVDKLTRL